MSREYSRYVERSYGGNIAPPGTSPEEWQPKKFYLKEKVKEMMRYALATLNSFPRRERTLADEMRQTILTMFRLSIRLEKKYYKKTTLEDLDIELAVLKGLVEIASDKDYCGAKFAPPLSIKQREVWSRYNTEVGNLIGGYKKSIAEKEKK